MKSFPPLWLLLLLLWGMVSSPAQAGLVVLIDMDTNLAGVQTTRNVSTGQTFDVALILELSGGSQVAGFSLGVDFDISELACMGIDVSSGRPPGFSNFSAVTYDNALGQVRPFDALSLSGEISASSTLLGIMNFMAISPNQDLVIDIMPSLQVLGIDGFIDENFDYIDPGTITFQGGWVNISAIPEPSALLLVASVGPCLFYGRRRRSAVGSS